MNIIVNLFVGLALRGRCSDRPSRIRSKDDLQSENVYGEAMKIVYDRENLINVVQVGVPEMSFNFWAA